MEITLDHSGFEAFMRGKCVYKCRICDRKYFDRYIIMYRADGVYDPQEMERN